MTECNCWECKLAQEHSGLEKVPVEVVLEAGGCPYCAMTGYQDYPTNKMPCPVVGHVEMHKATEYLMKAFLERQRRDWKANDAPCPYCKANKMCKHWTGLGWSRDYDSGYK